MPVLQTAPERIPAGVSVGPEPSGDRRARLKGSEPEHRGEVEAVDLGRIDGRGHGEGSVSYLVARFRGVDLVRAAGSLSAAAIVAKPDQSRGPGGASEGETGYAAAIFRGRDEAARDKPPRRSEG